MLLANQLKPWIKKQWCLPTAPDAEFVYHMEGILHVYTRPSGPARPQVCMDEVNAPWLPSMKEVLPMAQARRLAQRVSGAFYPPSMEARLNMTEIELSALDMAERHIAAWTAWRHRASVTIHWRLTAEDAE